VEKDTADPADEGLRVGPGGLDVALPAGPHHGDHDLGPTARAELREKSVDVRVRCPGCGRTASRGVDLAQALREGETSTTVSAHDLAALAKGAARRFRQTIPASCATALAQGIMEG
jgi:hypothetical protein